MEKLISSNPDTLARQIHDILTKEPVKEGVLVDILNSTDKNLRQKIRSQYKKIYSHPIQNDLSSNLSYKLKAVTKALFDTPYELDAREFHKGLHTLANDDRLLCELTISRPKSYLDIVDKVYEKFFGISLRDDIKGETSGLYTDYLLAIFDNERPRNNTINEQEARNIAKGIKDKGMKEYANNVGLFKELFIKKSREDLIKICRSFNELYGKSLYEEIKDEASGKILRIMKNLLFVTISPSEWFSKKLYRSMEGLGTNIRMLTRCLLIREDIDMDVIRDFYKMYRGIELHEEIDDETSGSYGNILMNLSLK